MQSLTTQTTHDWWTKYQDCRIIWDDRAECVILCTDFPWSVWIWRSLETKTCRKRQGEWRWFGTTTMTVMSDDKTNFYGSERALHSIFYKATADCKDWGSSNNQKEWERICQRETGLGFGWDLAETNKELCWISYCPLIHSRDRRNFTSLSLMSQNWRLRKPARKKVAPQTSDLCWTYSSLEDSIQLSRYNLTLWYSNNSN